MIPTLILFGLIFGRWWWQTLTVSAFAWPIVLLLDGAMELEQGLIAAAILAVINASAGVLVHQAVLWAYRKIRQ